MQNLLALVTAAACQSWLISLAHMLLLPMLFAHSVCRDHHVHMLLLLTVSDAACALRLPP